MEHKIIPAVVILAMIQLTLQHQSSTVTVPDSFGDSYMRSNNCLHHKGSISLNFSNASLHRLNDFFTSSPNVRCINFENNEITEVSPSTFRHMPNLHFLSLAHNRLDFAALSQLDGHQRLGILVLDDNRDANLTEGPILRFENEFPWLLELHARNCGFRDVESLATFAPQLVHLYLASNDLASSNLAFLNEAAPRLYVVDLSDNGLQTFDAGKLVAVNELHLDGNKFERLCAKLECDSGYVLALAGMKKLVHLSLARNAIANIQPSAFDDVMFLIHLDLSDNKIQNIEDGTFDKLIELTNLTLKGNLLSDIPDIRSLTSLLHLSLAGNNLAVVKNGSLFKNTRLKTLDLSNNKIETVEHGAFSTQYFLDKLDLSNNKLIKFTSMWIANMRYLRVLYLNNNLFTTIENLYLDFLRNRDIKLKEVHLQGNRITQFFMYSLRRIPDIALIFSDAANSTEQVKNAEDCKCDCNSNDIDNWLG